MAEPVSLATVYAELRSAIAQAGTQKAWADRHGISPQFVSDVLHTHREPTDRLLAPLGLRRRVIFERIPHA